MAYATRTRKFLKQKVQGSKLHPRVERVIMDLVDYFGLRVYAPEPEWGYSMFDDFNQKVLDETNENWILNSGSDDLAVDPAIVIAEGGTIFLDAGDGDGSAAVDLSQIVWAIPVQTDKYNLTIQGRLKVEDVSEVSAFFGLTDITTLEEPFSIAGVTVTSVASNAVCFMHDSASTSGNWWCVGVDGDTDASGNADSGVAAADGTWIEFECVIKANGEGADFYINGELVTQLTAAAVAASTNLYLTAGVCGDGSNEAASGLTVDYMGVAHGR